MNVNGVYPLPSCSIEKGIDQAELRAENIARVAALDFFFAVETFDTDAEAFAELPDEVQAAVVGLMIGVRSLGRFVIQIDKPKAGRRAEIVIPAMGVPG